LALREEGRGAQDGEHCHGYRNDGKASDTFQGVACFYLPVPVVLAPQISSQVQTWCVLLHKKVLCPINVRIEPLQLSQPLRRVNEKLTQGVALPQITQVPGNYPDFLAGDAS
jgi:hypothetical protein